MKDWILRNFDGIAVQAIGGLVVVALCGLLRWLWKRRHPNAKAVPQTSTPTDSPSPPDERSELQIWADNLTDDQVEVMLELSGAERADYFDMFAGPQVRIGDRVWGEKSREDATRTRMALESLVESGYLNRQTERNTITWLLTPKGFRLSRFIAQGDRDPVRGG